MDSGRYNPPPNKCCKLLDCLHVQYCGWYCDPMIREGGTMLSTLQRPFKKRRMVREMSNGYKETFEPYMPPLLKHAVSSDVIDSNRAMLKITYASEGSNLVQKKSLISIQVEMIRHFDTIDEISNLLWKIKFPSNVVAVSFSMPSFKVGKACTDFFPFFKNPQDALLTYQRVSESVQATYYHDEGIKFLAGMCIYPVPHGDPLFLDLDCRLINLTKLRGVPFPLGESKSGVNFIRHKAYGRFCQIADKAMLVDFNNWTSHKEFDFTTKDYKYVDCPVCAPDIRMHKQAQEQNLRPCRRYVSGTVWARSSVEAREIETLEDPSQEVEIPEYPTEDGEGKAVLPVPDVLSGEILFDESLKNDGTKEEVVGWFGRFLKNNPGLAGRLKRKSVAVDNGASGTSGKQCSSGCKYTSL